MITNLTPEERERGYLAILEAMNTPSSYPLSHEQRSAACAYLDEHISLVAARAATEHLLEDGLRTDGGHHKQWYLEEIAATLGFDPAHLREFADEGIAP